MLTIPGYSINETVALSRATAVYRGVEDTSGAAVILKTHIGGSPTYAQLAKLEREYEFLRLVQSPHVVAAHALQPYGNGLVLVLADTGSADLDKCLTDGLLQTIPDILRVARDVVSGLAAMHRQDIAHRDICPRNLVFNSADGVAQIIDLSVSSQLRGRVAHQAPHTLTGTLAYIAPEQTGRISQSVDHRADFYSLGVTLYQLLTGRLPFTSQDPLELVHAHLAVLPEAPHTLRAEIPEFLSQIVMHLLEKDSLRRYQDSRGIAADLQAVLDFLERDVPLPERVGTCDRPHSFEIPVRLYGRGAELQALQQTLERASDEGTSELLLIAGQAGIGKSSLVRVIHQHLATSGGGGYLMFGKFDRLKRDVPFSALWQAIGHWTRQILSESENSVQSWRRALSRSLGRNGRVLIDAVPTMAHILGSLPPLPPLAPREVEARFQRVFEIFFSVIASAESRLLVCLDDLHWADSASLALMELLLSSDDVAHLVMVGTYRDNEVGPTSPLTLALERLRRKGHEPRTIALSPLGHDALTELLTDTFHRSHSEVRSLAALVANRCAGNPMVVRELLGSLVDNGLIRRSGDEPSGAWTWDLEGLRRSPLTENAADIVAQRISTLPTDSGATLGRAACIGDRFSLALVAELSDITIGMAAQRLQPALKAELLYVDQADENTFFALAGGETALARFAQADVILRFAHDRVRQAAYRTLVDDQPARIHLRIARSLAASVTDASDEHLFEVLNHYHSAHALIDDADERLQVAGLSLRGGSKALSSTAYQTAGKFCDFGVALLGESGWRAHYAVQLPLHLAGAGAALLAGDLPRSGSLVTRALEHAQGPLDRGQLLKLRVLEYTLQGRFGDATAAGRQALEPFGIALPEVADARDAFVGNLQQIEERMRGRAIASLIDLPRLQSDDQRFIAEFLHTLNPSSYFTSVDLMSWLCSTQVLYSLEHGHGLGSSSGYAAFGNVIGNAFGRHRDAYEYGQLAIDLADAMSDGSARCTNRLIFTGSLLFWRQPLRAAMPIHEDGVRLGLEFGELMFAGYIQQYRIAHAFFLGEPLAHIKERIPEYVRFCVKTNNINMSDTLDGIRAVIGNLTGESAGSKNFDLPERPQAEFLDNWSVRHSAMALPKFFVLQALALLLYDHVDEAYAATERARRDQAGIFGAYASAELVHVTTLVLIRMAENLSGDERTSKLESARALQETMRTWADNCPDNFNAKWQLAQAEWLRVTGDRWQAAVHYDHAVQAARAEQRTYTEAMAHELAGKFWLQAECVESGNWHISRAMQLYLRWGAARKVELLRARYPSSIERGAIAQTPIDQTTTWEWGGDDSFAAASILKLTRAVSSSLVQDDLQEKLLRLAIESVGATRGCLLSSLDGAWVMEAELDVTAQELWLEVRSLDTLAQTVVNYVRSRRQAVVLSEGQHFEQAGSDPYLQAHPHVAIVCVPIVKQESTVAVLYLENDLVPGAFRSAHAKTLEILASQAATSLENARLYRRMELLHADLQRRYEDIERASRVRTEFVTSMSHELRTPLNALINIPEALLSDFEENAVLHCASCAEDYELPEELSEAGAPPCPQCGQALVVCERMFFVGDDSEHHDLLSALLQGSNDMLKVVSELLDFSDLESDSIRLILESVPVPAVLQAVAARVSKLAADKRISVTYEAPVDTVSLIADRAKFTQILFNVVENAVKFTEPDGAVRVAVQETVRAGRCLVYISVNDNGIGIPNDQLDEIFESFRQLESRHVRQYGGTGLGLAVTKKLVELHQGVIWATSQESEGSTFHIELPASGPRFDDSDEAVASPD